MTLASLIFGTAMGCAGFLLGLWAAGPSLTEEDIRKVLIKYAHDKSNSPAA